MLDVKRSTLNLQRSMFAAPLALPV